jgi:hypothetical protein
VFTPTIAQVGEGTEARETPGPEGPDVTARMPAGSGSRGGPDDRTGAGHGDPRAADADTGAGTGTGADTGTGAGTESDGGGGTSARADRDSARADRDSRNAGRVRAGTARRGPQPALRWAAFCCLLAPVALAAYGAASSGAASGATPFGNAVAAAGLSAVAAGCRLLLNRTRPSSHARVSPLNDSGRTTRDAERPGDRPTPRRTGARTESQSVSPMHEGSHAFHTRTPGD